MKEEKRELNVIQEKKQEEAEEEKYMGSEQEERKKGNYLRNFLLIMEILFIGIACLIGYKTGSVITERRCTAEIEKLNKQQEEKMERLDAKYKKIEDAYNKAYNELADVYLEVEKLQSEKRNILSNLQKISSALQEQLSREIELKDYQEKHGNYPVITFTTEIPLAGYLCDTKAEAKKVPVKLKTDYKEAFLRIAFKPFDRIKNIYLIEPNGRILKEIPNKKDENGILVPLNKVGIYTLKICLKNGSKLYLALNWKERKFRQEENQD